jgi:hypothetical protein
MATCRLHRMTPIKTVLEKVLTVSRNNDLVSAVQLELLSCFFEDFLSRRHVAFPSKNIAFLPETVLLKSEKSID